MNVLGSFLSSVLAPAPAPPRPTVVSAKRRRNGRGRITPVTTTRWLLADLEQARKDADAGNFSRAGRLSDSIETDGVAAGLLSTRTGGLVRLPRLYAGSPDVVAWLRGAEGQPGAFDRLFPSAELELLAKDGLKLGVFVGEFIQEPWAALPHLVRLPPEHLRYRRWEDRWYYQSENGLEVVNPGDGRWILGRMGGTVNPWRGGMVWAIGRAFIVREHAELMRSNYSAKLANPARVATAPQGASQEHQQSWFRKVMAWGVNTVFGMTPGYDVKLLESNGRGIEVFKDEIDHGERIYMIAIAGQIVTVTGGAGFANANIHATIRSDLVQATGQALAAEINEQGIKPLVAEFFPANSNARVEWDTRPPADLKAAAEASGAAADAIGKLDQALAAHGLKLDVKAFVARHNIPIAGDVNGDGVPEKTEAAAALSDVEQESADVIDIAPPAQDAAAALAEKMSAAAVSRCAHGFTNRCRMCGVERVYDFTPDPVTGEAVWGVQWRPIGRQEAAA